MGLEKIKSVGLGISLGLFSLVSSVQAEPTPERYIQQSNQAYREAAVVYCYMRWDGMNSDEATIHSLTYYGFRMKRMTELPIDEIGALVEEAFGEEALVEKENYVWVTRETLFLEIEKICPEYQ